MAKSQKPRGPRTDDELRRASVHLLYEVEMLEATGAQMTLGHLADPEWTAVLESFLVHARLLAQFLGWNRPGSTTGVASRASRGVHQPQGTAALGAE